MKRKNRGFSLLELLIVVAIILIIATIAIPSLLRSRQAAHEAAAVATLRTINTAEVTYLSTASGKFGKMQDLVDNALMPSNFGGTNPVVSGYLFDVNPVGSYNTDFLATAVPASPNDGRYGYYTTPDGTVRFVTTTGLFPAGSSGMPVSQ